MTHSRARLLLRVAVLTAVAAYVPLGVQAPAAAACDPQTDVASAIRMADSVFVGLVVEVADLNRVATMEVVEIWKGRSLPERVQVQGTRSGGNVLGPDDRTYVAGATYLVVPFGARPPFYDDRCTGTSPYVPFDGQIPDQYREAVGATEALLPILSSPAPETEGDSGGGRTFAIVDAVLGLLAVAALLRSRWKRRRASGPSNAAAAAPTVEPRADGPSPLPADKSVPEVGMPVQMPVATVKRKRRARVRRTSTRVRSPRFGKSGDAGLEAVRKKTRKIKE